MLNAISMKVIGETIRLTDTENIFIWMELLTKANGKMTSSMARV